MLNETFIEDEEIEDEEERLYILKLQKEYELEQEDLRSFYYESLL